MKKVTFNKNLSYIYNAERKGAKYSIDGGQKWMNHGDLCECLAKSVLGYEAKKDANTRNDKGHDIPELNASVKSWNCGLSDRKDLGNDAESFFNNFFATELPNTQYIWVYEYSEFVDLWFMTSNEFKAFTKACGMWDNYCVKWRFKMCDNKVNAYLESKLGE